MRLTELNRIVKKSLKELFRNIADPLEYSNLKGRVIEYLEDKLKTLPEGSLAPDRVAVYVHPDVIAKHENALKTNINDLGQAVMKFYKAKGLEIRNPSITITVNPDKKLKTNELQLETSVSKGDNVKTVLSKKQCRISCMSGEFEGSEWIIESGEKLRFGRHTLCEVKFSDKRVSREHAELQMDDKGRIFITDTGSGNGTFINDDSKRLKAKKEIKKGSRFRFCTDPGIEFKIY
ncbi:MAG: FHA domain-containing protein [bacterium]|nr:FHA domain-containing protein [bacterium]